MPTDPLSHVGLSMALVFAVHYLLLQIFVHFSAQRDMSPAQIAVANSSPGQFPLSRTSGWNIDYRLVIIGSLLPDLIDKSVGQWFLPEIFSHAGRSFAHTLLFNGALVVFSILVIPFARSLGPLLFSLASSGHLFLDRMWESPRTLFWPKYGLSYGGAEFDLSPSWLHWMQTGIGPVLLDWTGALVLLLFAIMIYRRRNVLQWIKSGVS